MFWQLLIFLVLLIPLLAVILDSQVGKALAARLEEGGGGRREELLQERIRYLEGEVERLSSEVQRLDEESSFLHELLADRPPPEEGGRRTLDAGDDPD